LLCGRFKRHALRREENFLSKKDERQQRVFELIKQSIAARQEKIKLLWDLKEQDLTAETSKERKLKEQRLKAQKLKKLLDSVRNLTADLIGPEKRDLILRDLIDRVSELVELVGLQDREIDYLTQFRRELERIRDYYPEQLQYLSSASLAAELQPVIAKRERKRKPKALDELKRRAYKCPGGVGLIEWEFGGGAEAERRESLLGWSGLPYEPTCLDEIFRGGVGERRTLPGTVSPVTGEAVVIDTLVDMRRLEALFGLDRHRFPCGLQGRREGREVLYKWRAVVEIMRALLKEKRSKGKKPGPALRIWLEKPALRARVFSGLEARINTVCTDGEIADAFLAFIHPPSLS